MKKFTLDLVSGGGDVLKRIGETSTEEGVIFMAHPKVPTVMVRQYCEMARQNEDYPYDLTVWEGTGVYDEETGDESAVLIWCGRLTWQEID